MHVPCGKPIHENLKTSYVNTAALLADLQVTGFTGYLQLIFPYASCYIFIGEGAILNALDESGDRARRGAEAVDAILLRASSPDGFISVFSHSEAFTDAVAGRIDGEAVYENLESEFADLKKLVEKLTKDRASRFYVEVELGCAGFGVIYTVDGGIDAVISLANGEIFEGDAGYNRALTLTEEYGAVFHVYRCASVSEAVLTASANVLAFPEPTIAAIAEPPIEPVEETEVTLPEPLEAASAPLEETGWDEAEFDALISLMSEVTQVIERAAARLSKEGNFAAALRAGLLEVTEQYPFFDPFADEFEYVNGKIIFSASPPPVDFVNGLASALKRAVSELERAVPAAGFRQVIADALAKLHELRRAEFARFGIGPALVEMVAGE